MPDIKRPPITLRYTGLFDFEGLYAAVVDWSKHQGFMWHEKSYKHKVPTPRGAEQELDWVITKKVTNYISYQIDFTVHSWDQREVEVDIDGKKKALTSARIYIIMNGKLTYDWQKKFTGNKLVEKIGSWYRNFVYKKDVESLYFDQLYYRMWDLHAIMKKYFDMQTQKYPYKGYLGEQ